MLLGQFRIEVLEGDLRFPERAVLLIRANWAELQRILAASDDIAEFRCAKEVATFYIALENREQMERVQELLRRTEFTQDDNIAVCILDSGVNNGHLLIHPILNDADRHSAIPAWGTYDHNGHGTLMAGIAAYNDLLTALNFGEIVQVHHRLESAKILPPGDERTASKLWGYMTSQGLSRAEIQAPHRRRVACMAITSTDSQDRGRPSSWSATLDELASGAEDETKRLFVISVGTVDRPENWANYPSDNETNEVHDPAQSWNALTVGAFTEKVRIDDPMLANFTPIAPAGGLSPYSSTSAIWPDRIWPIKPEVLFRGGKRCSRAE